MQRCTPRQRAAHATRWPVAINNGYSALVARPASCSPYPSAVPAPGSLESGSNLPQSRFFATPIVGTSTSKPKYRRRQDGEDARSRDHRQTLNPAFATASPHAASSAGYFAEGEKTWNKVCGGDAGHFILHQLKRGVFQQHQSPLASLLRPAQIRHRLRRSDPADLIESILADHRRSSVRFVERVMTRDP